MFILIRNIFLGLIVSITLASCGGGSGSQVAEGGIGGTGISTGSVTGFGSIIVNGVHFDTTGAVVYKDDDTPVTNMNDADINLLISLGMVVTVKGEINDDGTGIAETITYQDIIEGPVASPSGTSLSVLGQTVNVVPGVTQYACDDDYLGTYYVGTCTFTEFSNLEDGQVIEVSGFIDQNGDITAGYIELQEDTHDPVTDTFEIKGTAIPFDDDNFYIGTLKVTHGYATSSFDNQFVEAKGIYDLATNTLIASEVEIEDESFDIEDADRAELEGIASTGCATTSCDFTLSGITVRVGSNTQYSGNGISATDINAGVKLEAEGTLQGGILIADEIDFE